MKKLLVVEDDVDLNTTIVKYLKIKSFKCEAVYDGEDAVSIAYEKNFELILLDIKLPSLSGFEVAKRIREFSNVPIIFLTSLDTQEDIEKGFLHGGDDYITKPFSLNELYLRINAILRRNFQNETTILISKDIVFNTLNSTLTKNKKEIHLTAKEILLLSQFLQNRDKILTKEEIFSHLYEYEEEQNDASLRVFINRLRKIIGKEKIQTIKTIGYRYVS
ncbi:MAG: response regulator transcription factor [Sulfurimonas sp.]|nr:response regulator transcription factor [Sulfurimonas sp.]